MSLPIVVSACLAGQRCRYDGGHRAHPAVGKLMAMHEVVLVCPEEMGGLGTPRPPAGLDGGDGQTVGDGRARVMTGEGEDVTEAYCEGARRALEVARNCGARRAVLKARSPSCGCGQAGTLSGPIPGDGVTAALFKSEGLEVLTEEDLS